VAARGQVVPSTLCRQGGQSENSCWTARVGYGMKIASRDPPRFAGG